MTTKEITIAGKTVKMGYCFATEIAYKDLSDEDIMDFIPEVGKAVNSQRMPDIKKTLFAIIAAIMVCYDSAEEAPVKDTDLMTRTTPTELGNALATFILLRNDFYRIPSGEPKDKPASDGSPVRKGRRKNA